MEGQRTHRHFDWWLANTAAEQHGVVGLWQIRDEGFQRALVDSRLARGRLHIVQRGVYAVGHQVLSRKGRWMAATLTFGSDCALSHRSAAALWRIGEEGATVIEVAVPGEKRGSVRRRNGLRVHRPLTHEATTVDGIPVTTVAQTLLDLAATRPAREVARAVEAAERARVFDLTELERLVTPGRAGVVALREAVAAYDGEPTESELERRFLELCDDAGIPRPRVGVPFGEWRVDFLWPDVGLVVETDGGRVHGTPRAVERDRAKEAALVLAGFAVQRFSWRQVVHERAVVAEVVRRRRAELRALRDHQARGAAGTP